MTNADAFFGLSQMHLMMAAVGTAVLIAHLLPRVLFKSAASSSLIMMLAGLLIFNLIPGMPNIPDPTVSPALWEITSELVVIVVLFATGLRIDT
jgi:sodium/hydrogen antiporter